MNFYLHHQLSFVVPPTSVQGFLHLCQRWWGGGAVVLPEFTGFRCAAAFAFTCTRFLSSASAYCQWGILWFGGNNGENGYRSHLHVVRRQGRKALCKHIWWFQLYSTSQMHFYPTPILAFGYYRCLPFSVRPCVNHLLVRTITRDWFKLGSSNLDQRCEQATGLDAWASRVKCPARFVSHLHDICIYMSCL